MVTSHPASWCRARSHHLLLDGSGFGLHWGISGSGRDMRGAGPTEVGRGCGARQCPGLLQRGTECPQLEGTLRDIEPNTNPSRKQPVTSPFSFPPSRLKITPLTPTT